jgi:site-specific recombinase XerD
VHSPETRAGERGREVTDVDALIQGYSSYLSALKKSPRTVEEYTKDVTRWAAWWQRPVEFFKQDEWDDWTASLDQAGVSGRSINRYRSSLKRFFKYLRRRKLVTHDPSYDSEPIQTEKRLPEILTRDEVELMRSRLKVPRTKALFALLYDCGLRSTEARELLPERIGPDSIHVSGKRAKDRVVPIVPATRTTLEAWLKIKPASPHLFPTVSGTPMGEVQLYQLIRRVSKGIPKKVTPHTLRHSIATHLIEGGMPIERLQEFLGHESIETTRIYVRIAQSQLKDGVLKAHPMCHAKPQLP